MQALSILEIALTAGARKPHSGPSNSLGQFLAKDSTETCLFIVESVSVMFLQFKSANTRQDLFLACCSFYHSVTGVSLSGSFSRFINELIVELTEVEFSRFFQSDTPSTWLEVIEGLHNNAHKVVGSPLGAKIVRVFNHVIAHAFYTKLGIDVDLGFFGKLERKVIRPTVWNVMNFLDAIVSLVLFLCKAGRQAILTQSLDAFYCDDDTMTVWLDKASRLRKDAEFLNNPAVLGTSLPALIQEIKDAIAEGNNLLKVFKKGREHSVILNINLELEVVLKRHTASLMASSFRRAPIGVFVYGGSSIGKSTICTGLFNHYCSVRGIEKEAAVLWTRTENDDYYSGYKSHFAGVLHDDAAKFKPAKVQGIDTSFADIISEINNVQFVTPQAELNDKGKIPFRSEWVGVSSNVEDLTAGLYFNCPAAFFRRFAVRITPTVKPEFRVPGQNKIDTSHFVEGEQYPDLWNFKVDVPIVDGDAGRFETVHNFEHYHELLAYMTTVYEKHIAQQNSLMATVAKIGPEPLCECRVPKSICVCTRSSRVLTDDHMIFGPQAHFEGCTTSHHFRVAQIKHIFKEVRKSLGDDKLLVRCFKKHITDGDYNNLLCADYCDGRSDNAVIDGVKQHLERVVQQFKDMEPRERINFLTDDIFNEVEAEEEFLSFTPNPRGNGFYISEQLLTLRNKIIEFAPHLSERDTALLDVYLHEYAPSYISDGWPIGDIIQGGVDYVRYYGPRMNKNTERDEVRRFLLDETPRKWYEGIGVWYAKLYFSSPLVYSCTNAFISFPGVSTAIVWMFNAGSSPRNLLVNSARNYNLRLHGAHPLVKGLLALIATAAGLLIVKKLYDTFRPRFRSAPVVVEDSQPTDATTVIDTEGLADAQMDLNAQGRLPVKRATDKTNVWTVTERAITSLDVDPRRPHSEDQLCSAVRNNVVYCEVRGKFPFGNGMSKTRALVIDSETIVINNHALPVGAELTMWLGPKTVDGPQPVVRINPDEQYVRRYIDRDLAIINTMGLPHRFKDIKHMIARSTYSAVGTSALITKQPNGDITRNTIIGVSLATLRGMQGAEDVDCRAWSGRPMVPTVTGDCGSPLIIQNMLGCVIVGIHAGYHAQSQTAFAIRICREDFDDRKMPEIGVTKIAFPLAQAQIVKLGPNDKLYTDYHKDGTIMTHGQLRTFVARPKFTGKLTPHAAYVFSRGQEFEPPIVDNMAAPRNCGWQQPQTVLKNYLQPTHSIKESAFRACARAYVDYVAERLTSEDWEDMHPVPIDVAVNGFPGIPNMDAQKHTTSAGHGRRGPKLRYMTEQENVGVWSTYRAYDEDVLKDIDEMREGLARGIRPHAIYDACFKDELLSKAKVEAGRARAIYMCPVAFLVNMRMTTMGMCRVMIRRRQLFGMAVGLNTHSEEWNDAFMHCEELPGDNWIASDFQAFEAVLNLLISNCVSYVFTKFAEKSKQFDDEQLMILRTLLADITNATINFFGELITLLGGEASGQQLTTFFNCVANNLLHMYAFVIIRVGVCGTEADYYESALDFFTLVRRNTLGDDVYLKVHPNCPEYNHTSIQEVFASIGITYTMADKLAASRPYVSYREVTFLKRSFVDHESFPGLKVAALDRKSIYKMLCYTVPSKTVSEEEQFAAAIASAVAEAFFHGKVFYNKIVDLVESLPKSEELVFRLKQMPYPSWNTMVNRFLNSSPKLKAEMQAPPAEESAQPMRSYCLWSELELQTHWRVDAWGSTDVVHSPRGIYRGLPWAKNVPRRQCVEVSLAIENNHFSKNQHKQDKNTTNPTQRHREMTPAVVEKVINKLHNKRRSAHRRAKWESVVIQSEFLMDTKPDIALDEHVDTVQQVTEFVNEPVGVKLKFGDNLDGVASSMAMPQGLGEYLTRPRLISTFTWQESTLSGVKATLYPWQLYFADVNMTDKLRGFSLLRAKLHVKVLINGSPFYYGSLCAVYTPLDGWRRDTTNTGDLSMKLISSSQKPHMWLDNQNCSTAQMELPFIFPYPYLDISESSMLRSMGKLELIQYAPLLSANGVSGNNIDVQVYAWAEDVQLSGPTNMPIVQSEFVGDTQLSTVASNVANVAGKLDKVPIIGPYAKATEMAANAVGSVANFFGFTNVPNISDVAPMKPMVFQLASTELSEPTQKLSLQTKQETAIGQQLHGGSAEDDLVIERFASRSSYLTSSVWTTTSVPGDSLFACPVIPNLFGRSDTQIAFTPVGWLANHFQYWRGPMKFTFRVVRSPFHRGRLQISWDSRTGVLNQGPVLGNPNTITKIMDLDGEDEVSFVVPYMQPELFQTMSEQLTGNNIPQPVFSVDSSPPATLYPKANGIINVRVMNRLTAPEASSSVTLLVFVSAAEGFEFAGPADFNVVSQTDNTIWYTLYDNTQALAQSDITYDDAQPCGTLTADGTSDVIYQQVFGERLTSLRELLHRSSLAYHYTPRQFNPLTTQGTAQVNIPIKRLPPTPGVSLNGWSEGTFAGNDVRCFFTKFHPLDSIGSCFLGYKGSVNVTVNIDQTRSSGPCDTLQVRRLSRGEQLTDIQRRPNVQFYANETLSVDASTRADNAQVRGGIAGMALTNTRTNAGLSVQLPYYSAASFQLMDLNSEQTNTDLLTDRDNDWWQVEWRVNKSNSTGWFIGNNLQSYYSSGPDFDLFFFINVPILTKIQITD